MYMYTSHFLLYLEYRIEKYIYIRSSQKENTKSMTFENWAFAYTEHLIIVHITPKEMLKESLITIAQYHTHALRKI